MSNFLQIGKDKICMYKISNRLFLCGMTMKGLRRNDDAHCRNAGIKNSLNRNAHPTKHYSKILQ